jgi:hypothetical protein
MWIDNLSFDPTIFFVCLFDVLKVYGGMYVVQWATSLDAPWGVLLPCFPPPFSACDPALSLYIWFFFS